MSEESAERRQCRLSQLLRIASTAEFGTVSQEQSSFKSDHQFCTIHAATGNAGKYKLVRSLRCALSQILDAYRSPTRIRSEHQVDRSTGSVAAG